MDSIKVTVKNGPVEHDYDVIQNNDNYKVLQQGKEIAELQYGDDWQQLSGAMLPDGAIEEIIRAIQTNYN